MILKSGLITTRERKLIAPRHPLDHCGMARIAIDDKTGHITSQDHTKHMNEKDVYQNLTSGRDIRTLLHHCSTMTRISN